VNPDPKTFNLIRMKLRDLIAALSQLRLMEMRDQYFKEADRLRALGQSTAGIAAAAAVAKEQQAVNKKGRVGSRRRGSSPPVMWLNICTVVLRILKSTRPNFSWTCSRHI